MATVLPSSAQPPTADNLRRETPVFVFAYANDRAGGGRFLRNLAEERRRVKQALQSAGDQRRCKIVECAGATLDEVLDECQRHARSLALFHFAGHADSSSLLFETEEGHAHIVSADSFTEFLGGIHGLHLVFLNGCSTKAQVDALLASGVRAVIATSSAVADGVATELAERFYKATEGGATIQDAFHQAAGAVKASFGEAAIWRDRDPDVHGDDRDVGVSKTPKSSLGPFPWMLAGGPDALAHRLMAVRCAEGTNCVIVITATLSQFDAAMIARVTAELQRVSGDMSLKITNIEQGSVRLHLASSEEGARRLIASWDRGDLTTLCGFDVVTVSSIPTNVGPAAQTSWHTYRFKIFLVIVTLLAVATILTAVIRRLVREDARSPSSVPGSPAPATPDAGEAKPPDAGEVKPPDAELPGRGPGGIGSPSTEPAPTDTGEVTIPPGEAAELIWRDMAIRAFPEGSRRCRQLAAAIPAGDDNRFPSAVRAWLAGIARSGDTVAMISRWIHTATADVLDKPRSPGPLRAAAAESLWQLIRLNRTSAPLSVEVAAGIVAVPCTFAGCLAGDESARSWVVRAGILEQTELTAACRKIGFETPSDWPRDPR